MEHTNDPSPSMIINPSDRDFMIFDRSQWLISVISYDNPKHFQDAYYESLTSAGEGILIDEANEIQVLVVRGNPTKEGKPTWLFIRWIDERSEKLNGNEIAREILSSKYGCSNLSQITDVCNKSNFIPIEIRQDSAIPLVSVLRDEVPEKVYERITNHERQLLAALRAWYPKASYHRRHLSISSIEIDMDVLSLVGEDFGISRDVGYNLSSLVARTYTGYFLDCQGHQIPFYNPPIIRSLVQSQKRFGLPCFRAGLHSGCELIVYLKQRGLYSQYLQRIEYRFQNKEDIQNLIGGNSFHSLLELKVLLNRLYQYVFDQLFPCLNTKFIRVTDAVLRKAEVLVRHYHPENSDLVLKALLPPATLIDSKVWPAKERRIKAGKKAGVFQKVGPATKSTNYRLALDWVANGPFTAEQEALLAGIRSGNRVVTGPMVHNGGAEDNSAWSE